MSDIFEITVRVQQPGHETTLRLKVPPARPIADLIKALLAYLKIEDDLSTWELVHEWDVLVHQATLESRYPWNRVISEGVVETFVLVLRKTMSEDGKQTQQQRQPQQQHMSRYWPDHVAEVNDEFKIGADDDGDVVAETTAEDELGDDQLAESLITEPLDGEISSQDDHMEAPTYGSCEQRTQEAAIPRRSATRRATVRYYNRMNPERAYPLLVMLTKQMVEKVVKAQTEQSSTGPLKIHLDTTVEIEPIVPGCACYPAKIVTRVSQDDFVATFYVVPHVLGVIEGAGVVIRQDNVSLVEIKLNAKVVRRIWVVISGSLTLLAPFLSALARHYRVDFHSQQEDGFNFYLTAAQFVLSHSSPLSLTLGLLAVTVLLYWTTRAKARDVFWDITTTGPGEKLLGPPLRPRERILIPEKAIGTHQGKKFIYIVNGEKKVERKEVKLGTLQEDGMRVIEEGLEKGAMVIVKGLKRVRPGMAVEPKLDPTPLGQ